MVKMDRRLATEILAAHAEGLRRAEDHTEEYLMLFPEYRDELDPLLRLAVEAREALAPSQPSPAFSQELSRELLQAARRTLAEPPPAPPVWRGIVLRLAALGSALSVVGLVGYLLAMRRARSQPIASA